MASVRERTTKHDERTWQVLYRHGGKQASKTFVTASAAEEFKTLVDILGPDKALKESGIDDEPKGITVDQLWAKFIEWKGRPPEKGGVTVRTLVDYKRDYANWIQPWFGHREADVIDEVDVQNWVDHMSEKLAPKSVADRHMLMHSMFDFGRARTRLLVAHNPCKETDLPKRAKRKKKGATVPEFRALLEAAARRNPDAHDLILFLGETGWRPSEGAALAVRDVQDDGRDLWFDMTRVFRLDAQGRQYIAADEAKTESGFRLIRAFPESAAMVRRRLIGKAPGDLVFTNSRGRQWNQNTFLRDTWPSIVKAAGLADDPDRKLTPYWLRHMHVAVLGAAGAPMHEIQRRIGHKHYSTTVDVYGSMFGDVGDEAMARAAALMAGTAFAPNIAPPVQGQVIVGELG